MRPMTSRPASRIESSDGSMGTEVDLWKTRTHWSRALSTVELCRHKHRGTEVSCGKLARKDLASFPQADLRPLYTLAMAYTYHELKLKTIVDLREIAKTVENHD